MAVCSFKNRCKRQFWWFYNWGNSRRLYYLLYILSNPSLNRCWFRTVLNTKWFICLGNLDLNEPGNLNIQLKVDLHAENDILIISESVSFWFRFWTFYTTGSFARFSISINRVSRAGILEFTMILKYHKHFRSVEIFLFQMI